MLSPLTPGEGIAWSFARLGIVVVGVAGAGEDHGGSQTLAIDTDVLGAARRREVLRPGRGIVAIDGGLPVPRS